MEGVYAAGEDGGVLVDVIDPAGCLGWANDAQCRALGYAPGELTGAPLAAVYSASSLAVVMQLAALPASAEAVELVLLGRTGQKLRTLASAISGTVASRPDQLRLTKIGMGALGRRMDRVLAENRLLRTILAEAKEAHWCIEFLEPVLVAQPTELVVQEVFRVPSRWRLCNKSMARLYGLPDDIDLNQQDVRLYWPHTPANEAFMRQVVEAGFAIDGALSVDRQHDGSDLYVENDVRAEITDGFLLRLWGNGRNASREKRAEAASDEALGLLRSLYEALPDPILVVDQRGQPTWSNEAFASSIGGETAWVEQLCRLPLQRDGRGRWQVLHLGGSTRSPLHGRVYWEQLSCAPGPELSVVSIRFPASVSGAEGR